MTDSQATLHQLQLAQAKTSLSTDGDNTFVQTVEITANNPARQWLRLSALVTFLSAFFLHQYVLQSSVSVSEAEAITAQIEIAPMELLSEKNESKIARRNEALGNNLENTGSATPEPMVAQGLIEADPFVFEVKAVDEGVAQAVEQPQYNLELNLLKKKQLDLLFRNAQVALSKDRLLTPQSDNAVQYFNAMLEVDAADERALEGLKDVAQRYKTFAIVLAKRGDITQAAVMLERAESIVPMSGELSALIAQLPSQTQSARVEKNTSIQPLAAAKPQSSTVEASVERSEFGQMEGIKAKAKTLLNSGRAMEAVDLLSTRMAQYSTDGEFVELLHQAYLSAGLAIEAQNLRVTMQGILPGFRLAKMQAMDYVQTGRVNDAITVLEKNLPSFEQDKNYYGLLAGLYYKAQRFSDAERAYEKLLAVASDSGSSWLGYAVALDAQGDKKALAAFHKALSTLPAQDASRQYVEQRVRELSVK